MTTKDLIELAGRYSWVLVAGFAAPPIVALLSGLLHGKDKGGQLPWKYVYSLLVYIACIPGILAAVLVGYALFFTRQNLLEVNLLVYALPLVSMLVTLGITAKNVAFDEIPGFDRLWALMVLIGVSFAIALAVTKTRIWIFFGGSIGMLLGVAAGCFVLLKWGTYMLFRRPDEPKKKPPALGL